MELTSSGSTKAAFAVVIALFAVGLYWAGAQSITAGEAADFERLVRPAFRDILAQRNAGGGLLDSLLVKRSVGLLRLSEFSFRLPTLLCEALYLWAVVRIAGRVFFESSTAGEHRPPHVDSRAMFVAGVLVLSLNPLILNDWSMRRGYGMALGLWAMSLERIMTYLVQNQSGKNRDLNLAGMWLGLSVAASLAFAIPGVALAGCFFAALVARRRFDCVAFTERFVATAVVTVFVFLVIPLTASGDGLWQSELRFPFRWQILSFLPLGGSLAAVVRRKGTALPVLVLVTGAAMSIQAVSGFRFSDSGARSLVRALRREAGDRHVRIATSPALYPVLNFYRARYRLGNWENVRPLGSSEVPNYYVWERHNGEPAAANHLRVIYRDGELTLARLED